MADVANQLQELQAVIARRNDGDWWDEEMEKIYFSSIRGLFHVEFYGSPFDESSDDFINLLCQSNVAVSLRSLAFRGPDEGANGTRNWNFRRLLDTDVVFPNLLSFFVEPTEPEHHNNSVIAEVYDEEGQIAELLAKMPQVLSMTVPSAPDATFFQKEQRTLKALRVESGYDHQKFIVNLSQSNCFSNLGVLDFGDFNQRYLDNYSAECTPFEHYVSLFQSPAFQRIRVFTLRNSILSAEELVELRRMKPDIQFRLIQSHGQYVK